MRSGRIAERLLRRPGSDGDGERGGGQPHGGGERPGREDHGHGEDDDGHRGPPAAQHGTQREEDDDRQPLREDIDEGQEAGDRAQVREDLARERVVLVVDELLDDDRQEHGGRDEPHLRVRGHAPQVAALQFGIFRVRVLRRRLRRLPRPDEGKAARQHEEGGPGHQKQVLGRAAARGEDGRQERSERGPGRTRGDDDGIGAFRVAGVVEDLRRDVEVRDERGRQHVVPSVEDQPEPGLPRLVEKAEGDHAEGEERRRQGDEAAPRDAVREEVIEGGDDHDCRADEVHLVEIARGEAGEREGAAQGAQDPDDEEHERRQPHHGKQLARRAPPREGRAELHARSGAGVASTSRAIHLSGLRGVAQSGSAPALGAGGRRFKSGRPD